MKCDKCEYIWACTLCNLHYKDDIWEAMKWLKYKLYIFTQSIILAIKI